MSPSIFTNVVNAYLPEPHASLLNGILFGTSLKTTKIFYEQLKKVGLLHIVVLSGVNITLLAAIVATSTRYFSKHISIMLTILIVVAFVIFVGPQAPIVRAALMAVLTLVAILFGRRNFALYSLFLSAIVTGICWPHWLKTVSFQLSYGATLGLILFSKKNPPPDQKSSFFSQLSYYCRDELQTSFAAQIFTAPIIFLYFKEISLIAPISNLCVSFVIAPLMIFGFLTALLGKINFYLGLIPAYICYGLLNYVVFAIKFLSLIPFSFLKF